MTRVAAVIPNYNGSRHLRPLLADIAAQTSRFDQVIVADNGSADDSASVAEALGATVLRSVSNLGFAAAVNRGVASAATSDVVAILNNDLRLNPQWLERMLAALSGGAAFACGKLLTAADPRVLDGAWDLVCRGGTALRAGATRSDGPLWSESRAIFCAPFTAILVRRDVFLRVGGLDEAYGSYLEDVDFGIRCGSEGHTGRYVPDAVATHIGSATRGYWHAETVRQIARNQVLLVARNYEPELVREFGWPIAVAQALWGLVALRHGRGGAWLKGKLEGLQQFRRYRRRGKPGLRVLLTESENEIRRIQASAGYDWYWRLYFALVR